MIITVLHVTLDFCYTSYFEYCIDCHYLSQIPNPISRNSSRSSLSWRFGLDQWFSSVGATVLARECCIIVLVGWLLSLTVRGMCWIPFIFSDGNLLFSRIGHMMSLSLEAGMPGQKPLPLQLVRALEPH